MMVAVAVVLVMTIRAEKYVHSCILCLLGNN